MGIYPSIGMVEQISKLYMSIDASFCDQSKMYTYKLSEASLFVTMIFDIFHYIEPIYINVALWSVFVSSI